MDRQLSGKVAVVTGASKGIGLAVTQALAGEGVRVVAGARSLEVGQRHAERGETGLDRAARRFSHAAHVAPRACPWCDGLELAVVDTDPLWGQRVA